MRRPAGTVLALRAALGLGLGLALGLASPTHAAPAAELVVLWAPGRDRAPVSRAARAAGVALVDQTPPAVDGAQAAPQLATAVRTGVERYDALRFDDAWAALEDAEQLADRTGAAGLAQAQLSDLFLYRGLVRTQRGDPTGAWDELVTALVIAPARVFDPARFPPRVLEELERARAAATARPRAALVLTLPPDCTARIDGSVATPAAALIAGPHWVTVGCARHEPWSGRVEVVEPATVVTPTPVALVRPTDSDALIQARAASARAVLLVDVGERSAVLRLLGVEGRVRSTRTVALAPDGELSPVAEAMRELLVPEVAPQRWYRSRWVWAAGAAALAAAIAIPLTAAFTDRRSPSPGVVGPGPL